MICNTGARSPATSRNLFKIYNSSVNRWVKVEERIGVSLTARDNKKTKIDQSSFPICVRLLSLRFSHCFLYQTKEIWINRRIQWQGSRDNEDEVWRFLPILHHLAMVLPSNSSFFKTWKLIIRDCSWTSSVDTPEIMRGYGLREVIFGAKWRFGRPKYGKLWVMRSGGMS